MDGSSIEDFTGLIKFMKSKLILYLALVLSGCATNRPFYTDWRAAYPSPGVYLVQPGDNAAKVAKNLCLSVKQLATLNPGADMSHLKIGQRLYYAPVADTDINGNLTKQISAALLECETIKPGMTRAELMKIFVPEGGLSTSEHETFTYRRCSYIKVDVDFNAASKDEKQPTDIIRKISKPYLDWYVID